MNCFTFPSSGRFQKGAIAAEECYVHVRMRHCEDAVTIVLHVSSAVWDHTRYVDTSEGGQQNVCLPVPCQNGHVLQAISIFATAPVKWGVFVSIAPMYGDTSIFTKFSECMNGKDAPLLFECATSHQTWIMNFLSSFLNFFQR